MKSTKWIKIFFGLSIFVFLFLGIFNYKIDVIKYKGLNRSSNFISLAYIALPLKLSICLYFLS